MVTSYYKVINDIDNNFGNDLSFSPVDDLLTSATLTLSKQRVLRRLLTNKGEYIWHPEYGAGLPNFVGVALSDDVYAEIQSLITSQIFLESSVAKTPTPEIFMQTIQGGLFVQINYTESSSKTPIVLTFNVQ